MEIKSILKSVHFKPQQIEELLNEETTEERAKEILTQRAASRKKYYEETELPKAIEEKTKGKLSVIKVKKIINKEHELGLSSDDLNDTNLKIEDLLSKNKEKIALEQIAKGLGIPAFVFEQMLNMIQAQAGFRQQQGQGHSYSAASQAQDLDKAYQALGVEVSATDSEIKKAYRKLISENHPDKLIGQGMPEEMVKLATERSQEISTAYDIIQKSRGNQKST